MCEALDVIRSLLNVGIYKSEMVGSLSLDLLSFSEVIYTVAVVCTQGTREYWKWNKGPYTR